MSTHTGSRLGQQVGGGFGGGYGREVGRAESEFGVPGARVRDPQIESTFGTWK
ncbi:MAG: hypothetical protein IPK15_14425 [Verrucomicrobia bacterium]|nr:hypothetical protein [Verrucomicrobiota bacterium]